MKKLAALILLVTLATGLLALNSCGTADTETTDSVDTQSTTETGQIFTLTELASYDGTEGQPAYVAVDGVVYDVSASSHWAEGVHSECNLGAMAGHDLSTVIAQAPANMRSLLQQMPVVGRLE